MHGSRFSGALEGVPLPINSPLLLRFVRAVEGRPGGLNILLEEDIETLTILYVVNCPDNGPVGGHRLLGTRWRFKASG